MDMSTMWFICLASVWATAGPLLISGLTEQCGWMDVEQP